MEGILGALFVLVFIGVVFVLKLYILQWFFSSGRQDDEEE